MNDADGRLSNDDVRFRNVEASRTGPDNWAQARRLDAAESHTACFFFWSGKVNPVSVSSLD